MVSIRQITNALEAFAPLSLQGDFDNCGYKIGDPDRMITGVLVTLDTNEAIIQEAVKKKCNLIIEHHPSVFRAIKYLDNTLPLHRTLIQAAKHDIALYSAHTNLDFTENGLNDYVAKQMGLLSVHKIDTPDGPRMGELSEQTTLSEYADRLRKIFNDKNIVTIGDLSKTIKKVAVINGGGGSSEDDLLLAIRAGADVFVTGDVKYNVARLAKDAKYAIIQVGHYNSEQGFMPLVHSILQKAFPDVPIYETTELDNPYNETR